MSTSIFIALLLAVISGWVLCHIQGMVANGWRPAWLPGLFRSRRRLVARQSERYQNIPNTAVDTFIRSLRVCDETLDTHLSMGVLMRRQGEFDGAIRIHENLLKGGDVQGRQRQCVLYELARDFISAGLLDRGEQMLQELVEQAPRERTRALEALLELYQSTSEWSRAAAVARMLLDAAVVERERQQYNNLLLHLHCEMAEVALRERDWLGVHQALRQARACNPRGFRPALLAADMSLVLGRARESLQLLNQAAARHPQNAVLMLERYHRCHLMLDDPKGYRATMERLYNAAPSSEVLLHLVQAKARFQGPQLALQFLREQLQKHPSLPGLAYLLELEHHNHSDDEASAIVELLRSTVERLSGPQMEYKCGSCGFSVHQMHWHCPSCRKWDTFCPASP